MPALIFVPSLSPRIICILIKDAYPCSELSWCRCHRALSAPALGSGAPTAPVPPLGAPPPAAPLGFGRARDQIPPHPPLQLQQEKGAGGWQLPRGVRPSQEILGVGKEGKALPDIHVQSCWIQPGLVDSALLCFCFSCFSATFSADFLLHCTGLLYF